MSKDNTISNSGIQTSFFDYECDGLTFEGYFAFDSSRTDKRPGVLLAHAWDGQNEHMRNMARDYASRGYVAFALDAYGKGVRGDVDGDNSSLMNPLMESREKISRRMVASLNTLRAHELVDTSRVVAIGFCFGGLCVLDLARSGNEDVHGIVSIHALLTPPSSKSERSISAKTLILHGWEDPMAPPSDVMAIAKEFTDAGADWHLTAYGHAMHAYTHEGANKPEAGILYNEAAANRTAIATQNFMDEVFES